MRVWENKAVWYTWRLCREVVNSSPNAEIHTELVGQKTLSSEWQMSYKYDSQSGHPAPFCDSKKLLSVEAGTVIAECSEAEQGLVIVTYL